MRWLLSDYLPVKQNSILMHPETMRTCGCVSYSPMIVRGRGSKSVSEDCEIPYVCGKVLPLPSLPLDSKTTAKIDHQVSITLAGSGWFGIVYTVGM